MQVTGHFSGAAEARIRMGLPWMTRDELAQAIPPSYTEYIGRQVLLALVLGENGNRDRIGEDCNERVVDAGHSLDFRR